MISADSRDRAFPNLVPPEAGGALDPDWVLKMRAYLAHYLKTGRVHWVERGRQLTRTQE